ncbi:MAG: TIGR04086 family membrane protein [Clostridia bacterium]|nr:TIGR04086 family membrane protein [Clostridia bacterium]MBQ8859649.1 TIGR04086 family membrane protein [Clostridia bacterium]
MDHSVSPVLHRAKKERSLLSSVGTAVAATAVFLPCMAFLLTFFAYQSNDPGRLIPTFAYIAALTSSLFCGFLCARLRGKQGLLCGLLSGLCMVVLFLIALLVFSGSGELRAAKVLFTDIPVFLFTVLGGMIGGTKRAPKRRRVRR